MRPDRYSKDQGSEEDKDFFDKYSTTGESEWSRGSTIPFDEDQVLSNRRYLSHAGKGPKGYTPDDSRVWEDVADALFQCAEVDATEISIEVQAGAVILKGEVDDRFQKRVAERAIESLPGVREVRNELKPKASYS